ncbi:MAG: hypothetical protein J6B39_06095 [Lachnospiraceae bacterium]|nr:hypothetical protein [Lachnospiraceae bacterium]
MPAKAYEGQLIPYGEVSGGYVYYCIDYSIDDGRYKRMLFRYNSETKESIKVMDEAAFEAYAFYGVNGENVYVGERGESAVYKYNNGEITEIFCAGEGITRCVSICGHLLYYGKEGEESGRWHYYELETGEKGTFIRPDTEYFFVIGFGTENTIFVNTKGNDASRGGAAAMYIDEYITGNENYLFDIQFAPSAKPRE